MSTSLPPIFAIAVVAAFSASLSSAATTTLLSLNCTTPPPPQPPCIQISPSLAHLLDRLTNQTKTAHFAVSSVALNRTDLTGLVQCRPDLSRIQCNQCVRFAKRTVLTLCPNSDSMAVWLDGCYVEASLAGVAPLRSTLTGSCSEQRPAHWIRFDPAFNALLIRLRSGGVSKTISDSDHTVHGYVDCVRTLSESECRSCIEEAVDNLNRSCWGRTEGHVIVGKCIARFEAKWPEAAAAPGEDVILVGLEEEGKGGGRRWRRVVLVCWGVGFACLVGFVWSVWLVERSILNRAKVGVIHTHLTQDCAGL